MIPRRAVFFWEGEPMPWLREQSVQTFTNLNPKWTVCVVGSGWMDQGAPGTEIDIAHRSDVTRYKELSEGGGVYFDTDIVFIKPFPDHLLEARTILPVDQGGHIGNVAVLGSEPGSRSFAAIRDVALSKYRLGKFMGYQQLGVQLLNQMRPTIERDGLVSVSDEFVVPFHWAETEKLWNDQQAPLPDVTIGVHWFGGDPLSKDIQGRVGQEFWDSSQCVVARAIRGELS